MTSQKNGQLLMEQMEELELLLKYKCARIRKRKYTKDLKCACINQPIFHAYLSQGSFQTFCISLKISNVLTNLLILELRRMDGIDKVNSKANNTTHISQYEKFLNEECKISFHFYI